MEYTTCTINVPDSITANPEVTWEARGERMEKDELVCCPHLRPILNPEEKKKVFNRAYKILKERSDEFDAIAVSGMSMALIAPVLAWRLKKEIILVRKPGEDTHSCCKFEGRTNQRVVMVDDLVSSGETLRWVKDAVEKYDCKLVGMYLYSDQDPEMYGVLNWSNERVREQRKAEAK
jgi:adenine/guanine phosphoribosyltransferase-like PRPP-binding protein